MMLIVLGITLWMLIHFMPSFAPNIKTGLINKIGNNGYRGIFSVVVLSALVLIVIGWRSTPVEYLYTPISALRHVAMLIMLVAFVLFGSAKAPVRIKRYIRHPQLMSVVLWAIAHLMANGEIRSTVLFSGMGIWALLQMMLINKREGAWVKPDVNDWAREVKVLIISVVIMLIAMALHGLFTGVALF